jgi:hypothetical protein
METKEKSKINKAAPPSHVVRVGKSNRRQGAEKYALAIKYNLHRRLHTWRTSQASLA